MTKFQPSRRHHANIRRRKEWLANATLAVVIVALAGCQNAQRWSQPAAEPSDQYFVPSVAANDPAASSAVATSTATGETKPWKSKIITTADDGTAAVVPNKAGWTTTASVIKWSKDVGSPDRLGGAGDAAGGGGLER